MREVVIASSVRTPIGRAYKGTLRATRPDELAAAAIKGALDRIPQLDKKEIEAELRAMRKQGKKIRSSKKSALAFLVRAGICDKNGRLTKHYR